ncbi:MAG: bis(5'-nucleosyl)-tetraphosphatase (symmetrical) YqeK [Anaerovoracaceae bacterium]
MNELIHRLDDYVKIRLTEKRYKHTLGVLETAKGLAERYGVDMHKAEIAAIFHDACKNFDIEEMNMLVEQYEIGDIYIDKPQLAHSKLAAAILKDKFEVYDEDILNAISYHTTGRADMSTLEKIIYVADATEPNRTYPDAKRLNALAYSDLDHVCYEIAERTLERVKLSGLYLDEDTVRARDFFMEIDRGKSLDNSENFAKFIAGIIDNKKGNDIAVIDISKASAFADYFVIATGGSERQLNAISDECEDRAERVGRGVRNIEGRNGSGWVLMDFGDVVVNIFTEEKRSRYDLEKIWSDCNYIDWEAE